MEEKLSVVIPVYNSEPYIRRALDSVLGQTCPVHEVVCVDDGSTDGSLEILKEYAKRDKRVKIIQKENGGSTSARKAGAAHATGAYLAFVDSDDFVEPLMYEEMLALAVRCDADLVTSGLIRDYGNSCTENNEEIAKGIYTEHRIKTEILSSLINTSSFYKTCISPSLCNKIFKTAQFVPLQEEVDDRIIVGDDDAVIYPYLFQSKTIAVSGKNYYHYCIREHGSNMSLKKEDDYESYLLLFEHLEKEFSASDLPGLCLKKQFQLLKTYFLMLRFPSQVLSYHEEVLYPFGNIKKTDKILLYGAGKFGVVMKSYLEIQGFTIAGWADKSANRQEVIRPDEIHNIDFDVVIITVLIADAVSHIRKDLQKTGIPEEKILYADARMIG